MTPTTEAMFTMAPLRCLVMAGRTALVQWNVPFRLTSSTAFQSSSFMRSSRPSRVMPALFTRMSMRPSSVSNRSAIAATSAHSATFALMTSARRPCDNTARAVSSARVTSRSTTATSAPSRAKASAMARPIPWAAPVTIATFPASITAVQRPAPRPSRPDSPCRARSAAGVRARSAWPAQ